MHTEGMKNCAMASLTGTVYLFIFLVHPKSRPLDKEMSGRYDE